MVLEEIPTRISLNTIPKAIVDALVNDNEKDLNLHHMMYPTMGATVVNSSLPPSEITFDYQLELAAISAAIEQMKQ